MLGVRNTNITTANVTRTSTTALASVAELISPIAAGQTQKIRYILPITVGATGGVKVHVTVPAGGTSFIAAITLNNTVAPSQTIAAQTASAAFSNALANAGTHWLEIDVTVVNGATAGNVDLQIAQNSSDALTLTLHRGATADIVKL